MVTHLSPESLAVFDALISLITEKQSNITLRVKYNKSQISVGWIDVDSDFISCYRRLKTHCTFDLKIEQEQRTKWIKRLDEVNIVAGPSGSMMNIQITLNQLQEHSDMMRKLLEDSFINTLPQAVKDIFIF